MYDVVVLVVGVGEVSNGIGGGVGGGGDGMDEGRSCGRSWEGRSISSRLSLGGLERGWVEEEVVSSSAASWEDGNCALSESVGTICSRAKRIGEASRAAWAELASRNMARAALCMGFWYSYFIYLNMLTSPNRLKTLNISLLSDRLAGRGTMRMCTERAANARFIAMAGQKDAVA